MIFCYVSPSKYIQCYRKKKEQGKIDMPGKGMHTILNRVIGGTLH